MKYNPAEAAQIELIRAEEAARLERAGNLTIGRLNSCFVRRTPEQARAANAQARGE